LIPLLVAITQIPEDIMSDSTNKDQQKRFVAAQMMAIADAKTTYQTPNRIKNAAIAINPAVYNAYITAYVQGTSGGKLQKLWSAPKADSKSTLTVTYKVSGTTAAILKAELEKKGDDEYNCTYTLAADLTPTQTTDLEKVLTGPFAATGNVTNKKATDLTIDASSVLALIGGAKKTAPPKGIESVVTLSTASVTVSGKDWSKSSLTVELTPAVTFEGAALEVDFTAKTDGSGTATKKYLTMGDDGQVYVADAATLASAEKSKITTASPFAVPAVGTMQAFFNNLLGSDVVTTAVTEATIPLAGAATTDMADGELSFDTTNGWMFQSKAMKTASTAATAVTPATGPITIKGSTA
jgi:hypothetical protein